MPKLGPCKTCQCFQKNKLAVTGEGVCLRFPPQPVSVLTPRGAVVQMMAPAVGEKSPGCFEHIPIEVDSKTEADKLKEKFNA